MYIYRETYIINAILWCCKSCDCNKDEYDRQNALRSWNPKNNYCGNTAPSLPQSCPVVSAASKVSRRASLWSQPLSKSPADLHRGPRSSKIWPSEQSNLIASWMHLHNCRCFQEHPRILLQSLSALCKAPGGPGSIWKYLAALVRATGVSGRFGCGFLTNLHFADGLRWITGLTIFKVSLYDIKKAFERMVRREYVERIYLAFIVTICHPVQFGKKFVRAETVSFDFCDIHSMMVMIWYLSLLMRVIWNLLCVPKIYKMMDVQGVNNILLV